MPGLQVALPDQAVDQAVEPPHLADWLQHAGGEPGHPTAAGATKDKEKII
jgi:hypothetical protein